MKIFFLIFVTLSFNAHAIEWTTIKIPGAKCGDGSQYRVFYKKGSSSKVAIELMGGGACWNLATCWGPNLRSWIHPIPAVPAFSYLTSQKSPLKDHSLVYFPYCNGDVFIGRHEANYSKKIKTYHHGYLNVKKTFEYLREQKLIAFNQVEQFVFYGSSAGGIGALFHTKTVDAYLPSHAKKLLIADSVGLHFGQNFWEKFSPAMLDDFNSSFKEIGMKVDFSTGFIAQEVKSFCANSRDWQMGFIQTTRDIIMSLVFGNISQKEHEKLVLGQNGIKNVLKSVSNCSTHIAQGQGHAILLIPKVAEIEKDIDSGVSAKDYVNELIADQN